LKDARIAISVASREDCMVTLRSAPGAAIYLGPQVFNEIIKQAKIGYESTEVLAIFDCGEDSGIALSALRHGLKVIRIDLPSETFKKISDIATQMEARVETSRLNKIRETEPVLDLLNLEDAESKVRSWLKGD
jgi:hypothetical protein|tara:strand:+ start:204 stop:602 length:399 start_codon:yes stop_codon:yes gene_type:complete